MSGFKRATVSISQEEYDRLREAEQRLRSLPKATGESQERITNESYTAIQATLRDVEQRESSLRQMLAGMSEYVRELEQNTSQALVDFESYTIAGMENYAGSLWGYCEQIIADHAKEYDELIAGNHRHYQRELGTMARRMRKVVRSQQQKKAIAEEWLTAAEQFSNFIRENYAWGFFLSDKYNHLDQQFEQVRQNFDLGLSEAVIAASQQLYLAFSDLRVELERMQIEWQITFTAVCEALEHVINLVEQSHLVQAVDLDGNPLDYLVNVDYWTNGRLTQLGETVANLQVRLHEPDQHLDTDTLTRWLTTDLPGYHQMLERIVLDARIAAINSQLRINIADLVVQALREQGFSLSNADYEANDMRLGYGVQLSNLEGSEVVVEVAPVGESIGDNELMIASHDKEQRTEHELVERWIEISHSLSSFGLDVGKYTTDGGQHQSVAASQPARQSSPVTTKVKPSRQNRSVR